MRPARIAIAALRERPSLHPTETGTHARIHTEVSRRGFFGLAGLAALGLSSTARAMETTSLGSFRVVRGRRHVAFALGGEDRWVVDTRRYDGRPQLRVAERGTGLCIELTDALFPGTSLPADFVCEIVPAAFGSQMKLSLALGNVEILAPFERWLEGLIRGVGSVRRAQTGTVAPDARLTLAAGSAGEFRTDGSFAFAGVRAATLEIDGAKLRADGARLSLLARDDPSLLERPARKRTLLSIDRGEQRWQPSWLPQPPRGRLVADDRSFDIASLETGSTRTGAKRAAWVAESGPDAPLAFEPAASARTPAGKVFQLPLSDVRYAQTLGEDGEAVLVSGFAEEPAWLRLDGCDLALVDAPEPGFVLQGDSRGFRAMHCEPALVAVAAALPGGSASHLRPTRDTRMTFELAQADVEEGDAEVTGEEASGEEQDEGEENVDERGLREIRRAPIKRPAVDPQATERLQRLPKPSVQKPALQKIERVPVQQQPPVQKIERVPATQPKPELGRVQIDPDRIGGFRLPANLTVSVVRPADFLALDFEFVNLRLDAGSGQLVRKKAGAAYLAVHFPAQHIQEQAFFEEPPAGVDPNGNRPDADPDAANSSETLRAPPVNSRIAGPSRLVFRLPNEQSSLSYTLPALLEACRSFPLQVAANAKPPDPPPRPKLGKLSEGFEVRRSKLRRILSRSIPTEPPQEIRVAQVEAEADAEIETRAAGAVRLPVEKAKPGLGPIPGILVMGPPKPPSTVQTALELPWRLVLSPHWESAWAHAIDPVPGRSGRTELWHTRLGVRDDQGGVDEENDHYRTVRAIWSPDYDRQNPPPHSKYPFRATLSARDRHEIVILTSDYTYPQHDPEPVSVNNLMLTSLGAWRDSRGAWEPPGDLEVEEWKHRATMARDHYVRVVYKGYLYPFRHRASLIKVTERKFQPVGEGPQSGKIAAYLRQRMFIVVREPEVSYAGAPIHEQRSNPFRRVRITTLETPSLADPDDSQVPGFGQQGFWPKVGGDYFQFNLVAWDWRGQRSEFTAPLIFVGASRAHDATQLADVQSEYTTRDTLAKRTLDGQKVAFAAAASASDDSTSLDTSTLTFSAQNPGAVAGAPGFWPTLARAEASIPAVASITGESRPSGIFYPDLYLDNGMGAGANESEIFVQLESPPSMAFQADQSGGLATPNMQIAGISRRFGPVGGKGQSPADLTDFAAGQFDPKEFFDEAKILGGIYLSDLLAAASVGSGKDVPKLVPSVMYPNDDDTQPPIGVKAELLWEPDLIDNPILVRNDNGQTKFGIRVQITKRFDAGEPDYKIEGELTHFALNLIGGLMSFLVIHFDAFTFTSSKGKKMDIDPKIGTVDFEGPLKFIEELKDFIPMGGSNIDITPQGIKLGYTIGLPAITAGVMTLQNLSFSAGVHIPFSGEPVRVRFAFCERENPFLLTVYVFGGGGFVGLHIGVDGVEILEISLEFGASISLDIGVASGGVYVMAGIYMKFEDGAGCTLTGYLRMGGALEILGIVTISLEFYMGLTYESQGNKVWGEARLTIEIEIAFISVPVEMSVRREFNDPELPKIGDYMSQPEWSEYCEAFAA